MTTFRQALDIQRQDDHRYYHHHRINQTLHFVSAISFLVAYAWLLIDPVVSALIAWLGGVVTYHVLANLYPELGATLPALILAGLLQLVLGRIVTVGRETAQA